MGRIRRKIAQEAEWEGGKEEGNSSPERGKAKVETKQRFRMRAGKTSEEMKRAHGREQA